MVVQLRVTYQSSALLCRPMINKNDQRLKAQCGVFIFTSLIFICFFLMIRKPQKQMITLFK